MKVIENKIIPPKGYKAITIGPYIFIKPGTRLSEKDYNHEAIHWEQYKETLVIGFFLIYVIEFIYKFIFVYRGEWKKTYHNLSMEKEHSYFYCGRYCVLYVFSASSVLKMAILQMKMTN